MPNFGLWSPDKPPFDNDGLITCTNVLPGDTSYLPIPSPVTLTEDSSLSTNCIGALAVRGLEQNGVTFNILGTLTQLFLLDQGTLTDVSRASKYNGQDEQDRWEFAQVGNDIIATNFQDEIQTYTLGTSALFANLGGSPPKARHVAKIGDFLVIGNLNDTVDGFLPQRVQWAGIGTTTTWTVSAVDQSDFNDLNNNLGWIQQIVGGEFGGLVFQEYGIIRMTYVGSPLIFQFDQVKGANGLLSPGSAINIGDGVVYLGQTGFHFTDGQTSINIGENQVNQYFFSDYDNTFVNQIQAFLYERYTIAGWTYRSINAQEDMNDKIIFYNYGHNVKYRWTIAEINNSTVYLSLSEGYTLEELDFFNDPSGSQTLETLPFSLDSKEYQGNEQVVGIINTNRQLAILSGVPLDVSIEAGELQPFEGKTGMVTRFRPLLDAPLSGGNASLSTTPSITMRIGYRNALTENLTYINYFSPTAATGSIPARATARYFRFELRVTGEFNSISGYDIESAVRRGRR
jgi:hypothetical protein